MEKKFVAVAGNIGVGKSTLVQLIADRMGWEPFFEPQADNPYLADFYKDMGTWSFHSQIFFLTRRLRAHKELCDHAGSCVQDRSVYEDAEVFARNLHRTGFMSDRDYQSYCDLYTVLVSFLPSPDLVVYLRAPAEKLVRRITQRGRDYEKEIEPEYLIQLNELYTEWIDGFSLCPVLTVPAGDLDYVSHDTHFDLVMSKIEDKLAGKEEVIFHEEEVAIANGSTH